MPTTIGNGVYIGPGAIIQMGVNIGDRAVISALSLVNPMFQRARGLGAVLLSSELGRIARPRFHNDSPIAPATAARHYHWHNWSTIGLTERRTSPNR